MGKKCKECGKEVEDDWYDFCIQCKKNSGWYNKIIGGYKGYEDNRHRDRDPGFDHGNDPRL